MKLDIYVNYLGTCEGAFKYYEKHLGGKMNGIMKHGQSPNPSIPGEWSDKVMHAQIEIGGVKLMGADIPGAEPMRSAYISLTVDSEHEADRVYQALTDGGAIFMKMEKTFFANRFAMFRDRFGTNWMLLQGSMG